VAERSGKRVAGWLSDSPVVDHLFAVAITVAYVRFTRHEGLDVLDQDNRAGVYLGLAGLAGGLLGLVFAAVAILRGLSNGVLLRRVRELHGRRITGTMSAALRALGLATVILVVGMLLDHPDGHPAVARRMAYFGLALGAIRMLRLGWVFNIILKINDADLDAPAAVAPGGARSEHRRPRRARVTP
jgi:hypothetical protein